MKPFSPDCARLVVGASGAAPTSEAAGTSAIAVLLSKSVLLAQNEVRLASRRDVTRPLVMNFPGSVAAWFENQKTDARFRKASARREADVVTNRTTDRA